MLTRLRRRRYQADLTVLDRDILAGPVDEIAAARVLHAIVTGRDTGRVTPAG